MKDKLKYVISCAALLVVWIGLEIWGIILDYHFYSDIVECIKMFIENITR